MRNVLSLQVLPVAGETLQCNSALSCASWNSCDSGTSCLSDVSRGEPITTITTQVIAV